MTREEFLQARRTGIGGSDIGAILGLSPWKTAYDVFLDKTNPEDKPETPAMYWGTTLEAVVASEYQKRTGRKVQRINQMLRHPEFDFAVANIDRAVINPEIAGNVRWKDGRLTTDRILECKTANGFAAREWGEDGSDFIPDTYLTQVQWYMGITGCEVADLAVLIGGNDYRMFTIEKDKELFSEMLEAADKFWKDTLKGIPPDPQTIHDAARRWPQHIAGKKIAVDRDIASECDELNKLNAQIKALEKEANSIKEKIAIAFGDAEEITFDGVTLATYKWQKRTSFDSKRLMADSPDIYEKYTSESGSKVLRMKGSKK